MRRIALCLFALAAVGVGVSCGDDGGPPLTAEEFAKQANAICKAGDEKLLAGEGKEIVKPGMSVQAFTEFQLKHGLPNVSDQLDEIAELNPPAKDKAKVKKMLAAGRKAIDILEEGLEKQGAAFQEAKGADPLEDFNAQAKALHLTDCTDES